MKKLFKLFVIFAVASMITIAFAGYNEDTYVVVPTVHNHLGGSTLKVVFPANSDSIGSQHTCPIFIGNVNDVDAFFKVIASDTADYNVNFHFSNDLTTWKAVIAATIDAITDTAEYDTLGGRVLTDFHKYSWMVIEGDAQAGVNITDILYLDANFQADVKMPNPAGRRLEHMFYTTTNVTNP